MMKNLYIQKAFFLLFGYVFYLLFSLNYLSAFHPKVSNLSNANFFFIGREEQLQSIHSFFKKRDRILFALTGGPGFGKTQIAKKYAQEFSKNYDLIWWFDAQQDLQNQYERLAIALNALLPEKEKIILSQLSKDTLVDAVKNILRVKRIRYLLIFDNAGTYAQVESFIPNAYQQLGKHVLLTSRIASIWSDKIEVGKFKRAESLRVIKAAIPEAKEEDMERLAEILSDYPLGLTIALGFIKSSPTATIDKYLSMHLRRTLTKSEKSPNMILDNYPKNALTSLDISLKLIEEESKDSLQTLFFMSFLNSKDIPESYIEIWLKKTKSSLTADEATKHVYDQSLIGVSETTEFNANRKAEGQIRMHYLSIHDLIHQLINESIPVEEKKELIEKTTEVMLEVFSGSAITFTKKIIQEPIHLLHAQKLCEHAKEIDYLSPNLLKVKVCILQCLMAGFRDFEKAKLMLEQIENELKLGLQLEPYYKALYNINKGFFESVYNANYDEAIRNMKEGLDILNSFKKYNEEKLRALANLAQYHALRGEINTADEFIKQGKIILESSESDHARSFFIFNWSFVLYDQGKFEEASNVLDKVKAYPNLAEDSPTLYHSILLQKIEILFKQRRLTEAQKHLKEYEEKMKIFFQDKNEKYTGLGIVWFFKSLLLMEKGKSTDKAIQYLSNAVMLYNELFHGDKKNKYQARAHLALGKAYTIKKDFKNALKEYLLSKEVYDLVLKEKKIDDVSDLYEELALLGVHIKDEELTHKYLKAHIDTFGADHHRTEQILKHLDHLKLVVPN